MLPSRSPDQAITAVVREEWGRILAALTKTLGDLQLAEDSLQDAVARALQVWPTTGLPNSPAAWLITTARHKAIDRLRRDARFAARAPELSHQLDLENRHPEDATTDMIPDKRLEMIFTCCHPALEEKTRVALTLRTLGGLSTGAIAATFLDKPEAMAQRLVRAKRKIAVAGIPYRIPEPEDLPARVGAVLSVVYLIFNQGYSSAANQSNSLGDEAVRLGRILAALMPDNAEVAGLLALMLLHDARRASRLDGDGQMVPLEAQNRARWDQTKIKDGDRILRKALAAGAVGPYQLQAAISAVHTNSPTWNDTDWTEIAALYGLLFQMQPTPVIQINHAVAVSFAQSAKNGLDLLNPLRETPQFTDYQPFHAAFADLSARAGKTGQAMDSYQRAIAMTDNAAERQFLLGKLATIS